MPYIKQNERNLDLDFPLFYSPGTLNYFITKTILAYIEEKELSYNTIATVTGVLENVKQEFYRRVAVPYEDKKIAENGDVF